MKIKETLLIFLLGLIVGVGISPLASEKPQEILNSPVSLTMAQTSNFELPTWEGEVLGAMVTSEAQISGENKEVKKTFREIMKEEENRQKVDSEGGRESAVVESKEVENEKEKATMNETQSLPQVKEDKRINEENQGLLDNRSGSMTIAVLGDSMVDTMSEHLPYLEKALKKYYPNYFFNLLNYGAGATNIEYGIQRLTNDYDYLGKKIPALVSTNPDIVIVESFAYNPWGAEKSHLDKHWLAMAEIVDILKTHTHAKILFLSTIAPNKANFGSGPAGVNWGKDQAWEHAEKISKYLQNTLSFAASQKFPVVDAYNPSIVNGDGNLIYINPGDHIHPSVKGCEFVADLITKKLVNLGWIK